MSIIKQNSVRLGKFIPNVMFNAINYRFIIYYWQFAILVSKYLNLVSMRMNIILYWYDDELAAADEEK